MLDNVVGRSERVKTFVKELAAMVKTGLPAGQTLVISAVPKVDKRQSLYKTCKAVAVIHELESPEKNKPWQLAKYARDVTLARLKQVGLKMESRAMSAFLDKVSTDARQIANEIEKLSVYVGDRREVTMADVDMIVSSTGELAAWDFADAVGARDLPKALSVLRRPKTTPRLTALTSSPTPAASATTS